MLYEVITGFELIGVSLNHTHGRADLVGEARNQGRDRRELLGDARTLFGELQLHALGLEIARKTSALLCELAGVVLQLPLLDVDVDLRCNLRVEAEPLLERRDRSSRLDRILRVVLEDQRYEQGDIERIGSSYNFV